MNKAWFFGDSFTSGFGAENTSEYYKKFGPGNTFSTLLSSYFNMQEVNLGIPGCSNYTILSNLLANIKYFQPNDVVVVGSTSPLRSLVPNKLKTELIDQKLFDSTPYTSSLAHGDDRLETILRDYCTEFYSDNIYLWSSFFTKLFLSSLEVAEKLGAKTILWDYSIWSEEESPGMKFENIYQHTKGVIYDLHWSFKGHYDAFEWIKKGLQENKKFLK